VPITAEQFEALLPAACEWAAEQEARILKEGVPLSEDLLFAARLIPVEHPDEVRLLSVASVPMPEDSGLRTAAEEMAVITLDTAGITFGHGIFIRSDYWGDRDLVVHELVHVSQYERLGGIAPLLRQYLHECLTVGYLKSPLEQEAAARQRRICQQ